MKYRPEIDGLRAYAVIAVILFHAGFTLFSGGYVGVDVFFVISGYLITSLILKEKEEGKFSVIRFYERRARRILPALFFVMLTTLPFAWFWLLPTDFKDFSLSLISVSTFSSNILFWQSNSYFDSANELKPLLHTWSLALEEQYYILFPIFLLIVWKYYKKSVHKIFIICALFSFLGSLWGSKYAPVANFYLIFSRGWELGVGAIIAFALIYNKQYFGRLICIRPLAEIMSVIGLLMIICSTIYFGPKTPFPGMYALIPTIGTGLIIMFTSPNTAVGRLLSTKLMVSIGLISYSAYLWHHALFAFARHRNINDLSQTQLGLLVIVTFALAVLSWKFIEQPFRAKGFLVRRNIFIFSIAGSLIFSAVGLIGYLNDGLKSRKVYADLLTRNYEPDNRTLQQQSWHYLRKLSNDDKYGHRDNPYDNALWYNLEDNRHKVLLIGNSHSKDVYNVLLNSDDANKHLQITRYGEHIYNLLKQPQTFFNSPNYLHADTVMIASLFRNKDLPSLKPVVERLLKDGKNVVIVRHIYEFYSKRGKNVADIQLLKYRYNGFEINDDTIDIVKKRINNYYYIDYNSKSYNSHNRKVTIEKSDSIISSLKKQHSNIIILDRMDYICNELAEECHAINNNLEKFFFDYGHHTLAGAKHFGRQLDQIGWLDPVMANISGLDSDKSVD